MGGLQKSSSFIACLCKSICIVVIKSVPFINADKAWTLGAFNLIFRVIERASSVKSIVLFAVPPKSSTA